MQNGGSLLCMCEAKQLQRKMYFTVHILSRKTIQASGGPFFEFDGKRERGG